MNLLILCELFRCKRINLHRLRAGVSMVAQASAAAAAEIDAACTRAGWALVQGLCCSSRSWAISKWSTVLPLLHAQLVWQLEQVRSSSFQSAAALLGSSSATAVPISDVPYAAVTDAWQWIATAGSATALLSLVRCVAPVIRGYRAACDTLAAVLAVAVELLLAPVPASASSTDRISDSSPATPPRAAASKSTLGFAFDSSVVPGPSTPAQCAAYMMRRSALQLAAAVLESASLLPIATEAFKQLAIPLSGVSVLLVSGGLVSLQLPVVEALANEEVELSSSVAVGVLMPAFSSTPLPAGASAPLIANVLADSALPELSFARTCLYGSDAVLTRGMGEAADPNLPPSLQALLSSTVSRYFLHPCLLRNSFIQTCQFRLVIQLHLQHRFHLHI